jgi:transposase
VPATTTKFTAERRKLIVEALRKGNTLTHAAGLAKISRQAVYDWLQKGAKQEQGSYRDFLIAVEQAQAESADELVTIVRRAGLDDWRAAMTMLERRFPDDYAKTQRHEVSGPKGEPIKVELRWPSESAPPR